MQLGLYNEIMKNIQYNLVSYEQDFGITPNLIKLSIDLANALKYNTVMKLNDNEKLTVYGIEIEIVMDKQKYIKVGYMR